MSKKRNKTDWLLFVGFCFCIIMVAFLIYDGEYYAPNHIVTVYDEQPMEFNGDLTVRKEVHGDLMGDKTHYYVTLNDQACLPSGGVSYSVWDEAGDASKWISPSCREGLARTIELHQDSIKIKKTRTDLLAETEVS